jgi:hypothetical protein
MGARPHFRWRFIAAWLCGFFGVAILLGGLGQAGMMAYCYAKFGLYLVRPDTPSLNLYALTPSNVARVVSGLAVAALLLVGCVAFSARLRRERL